MTTSQPSTSVSTVCRCPKLFTMAMTLLSSRSWLGMTTRDSMGKLSLRSEEQRMILTSSPLTRSQGSSTPLMILHSGMSITLL
ncbi:hypothetical protein DPMN_104294 [Dreissena polymorpha]|nr:hypothetical protein DPMN_104294 [Dreissena polymorpha]